MSLRRDVAWFLAAALVPAAAVGALGLRALRNEEAALRREASLEVSREAERAAQAVDDALEQVIRDMGALAFDEVGKDDVDATLRALAAVAAVTPPFAEAAILTADGRVLAPRSEPSSGSNGDDPSCSEVGSGAGLDRVALLRCPEARDASGRWIWPVVAIDELGSRADDALANDVAIFFETHASLMRPEERAIARDEVSLLTDVPEPIRGRMTRALHVSPAPGSGMASVLGRVWRSEAALRALAQGEQAQRFDGAGAAGALRRVSEGVFAGVVVTPETLARALRDQPPFFRSAAGVVVEVAVDDARGAPDAIEAVTFISQGLGFRARLARPAELAEKSSRSVRVLAALIATSAAVAIGLAALLFLRMRAARRTSELRTSFVAAVSHELKTPIASVQMLSELLDDGRIDESERAEVTGAIVREARRMGDTVERFLTYARMEKGKLTARLAPEDLAEIARDRVKVFSARRPTKRCEIEAPERVPIPVDRVQLELSIDNLLENAAKYAPDGDPYRVVIEDRPAEVVLRVLDDGPGIPKALRRRVFQAFERGDDRLSHATEGTGLGLALVRAVAEAHGGTAEIEDGPGCRLAIRLPRASADRGAS